MWIAETIAPLVLMGIIVVFVIESLKYKSDKGNLGKKDYKSCATFIR